MTARRTRRPQRTTSISSPRPPDERGLAKIRARGLHDSAHSISVLEDPDALEAACLYWIEQDEAHKWPFVLQWFRNYAYLCGNHTATFNWIGESLSVDAPTLPVPIDVVVPQNVENMLIEPHQVNVSMFNEAEPEGVVEPNSDQSDDIDAASLAWTTLRVLWERPLHMPEKLRDIGAALNVCGTASHETEYGDTGIYRATRSGRRAKAELGLKANVWTAFELVKNTSARDDNDSLEWIGRSSFEDLCWIEEMFSRPRTDDEGTYYTKNLREMGSTDGTRSPLYWWERVRDLLDSPDFAGHTGRSYSLGRSLAANSGIFRVLDVRPNAFYPKGRTIIIGGGKLLYAGPARAWSDDYPERWHGHAVYRYWKIPGRFWGYPLHSALVPLQRRVDAVDALEQLNREYMTIGQWLLPSAARVDEGDITGIPGRPIRYRSNAMNVKPEKVKHEPLPAELLAERKRCSEAIRIIGGVARFTQDIAPSAARAGIMLQYLDRTAKAAKSAMLQEFEASMEKSSENILIEASLRLRQNDPALTNRIRSAARGKSEMALRSFTGLSLRQNVHVRLNIRSRLLSTPEAEREQAMAWVQYAGQGGMTPEERTYFAKKAGFGDFEMQSSPQVERASRMLDRLADGTFERFLRNPAALVLPVDDPGIFAQVISKRMLEDRFIDYAPEVKNAIFALWSHYGQAAQAAAQAQQEAQIRMEIIGGLVKAGKVGELLKVLGGQGLMAISGGGDEERGGESKPRGEESRGSARAA